MGSQDCPKQTVFPYNWQSGAPQTQFCASGWPQNSENTGLSRHDESMTPLPCSVPISSDIVYNWPNGNQGTPLCLDACAVQTRCEKRHPYDRSTASIPANGHLLSRNKGWKYLLEADCLNKEGLAYHANLLMSFDIYTSSAVTTTANGTSRASKCFCPHRTLSASVVRSFRKSLVALVARTR
jgi:hypothetical protein